VHITVGSLRRISALLFDEMEALGHSRIEIRSDLYWEVDRAQRHNLDAEPENLTVGQLSRDWSNLEEMLKDEGCRTTCGLVWLASILREIGETLAGAN
jgi:hypothetical protein